MKKTLTLLLAILLVATMSACSTETQATPDSAQGGVDGSTGDGQGQPARNGNQTVGLVTEMLGNEVTIEVGEMQGGAMGGGGNMPQDGSEQEGAQQPTDGEMPEGFERPEGGEMPEGEGGQRGEGGEMPEGAQRPTGEGMASGGGMAGEGTDYSELITLTGETKTYNIPVGTPVTQFGTEMTFSQITQDMYISITLDEEDNITAVNILG